jgi:MFS-type transporter involved in bile tolerance (Atg22 family)
MKMRRLFRPIIVSAVTFFATIGSASTVTLFPIKNGQQSTLYPNQTLSVTCSNEELSKVIQNSYEVFLGKAAQHQSENIWKLENAIDNTIFFNYKVDGQGSIELFSGVTILTGKEGVGNSFRVFLQSGNGCAIALNALK